MPGRVSSLYGSRSGTGADYRNVPLDQAAYCLLCIAYEGGVLLADVCEVALWVLLAVLCMWECLLCLSFPSYLQDSGYEGVPITGHAQWAEVGGCILCVTLGEFSGGAQKMCSFFQDGGSNPIYLVPCMPALAGQPSLHGYYACMVYWAVGTLRRNCRQNLRKTFFFSFLTYSV